MNILVLGGDGFCGWPVALRLSSRGHNVVIVDNFSRRRIDDELGVASLTPIRAVDERVRAWREVGGGSLDFAALDIAADYDGFRALLGRTRPDAIVHLAAQRSVPYSTGPSERRRYTFHNNLGVTHNVLVALADSGLDAHLVHLSSTGLYGYQSLGYRIPEGYVAADLHIGAESPERRDILHPANPISIYALTKAQDQLALSYFNRIEGLRVTDLVQGTVWGTQTEETARDERLVNRFDYDVLYGTVVNRFALQAALGGPVTVYGSGRQTRAFIHLADAVRCIEMTLANPPARGERMRVYNQVGQTMRIADLAALTARLCPGVEVSFVDNPREEPEENDLDLNNSGLQTLGFKPLLLENGLLGEIQTVAAAYAHRCDPQLIDPRAAEPARALLAFAHSLK